jgi:hypothetical protein
MKINKRKELLFGEPDKTSLDKTSPDISSPDKTSPKLNLAS